MTDRMKRIPQIVDPNPPEPPPLVVQIDFDVAGTFDAVCLAVAAQLEYDAFLLEEFDEGPDIVERAKRQRDAVVLLRKIVEIEGDR